MVRALRTRRLWLPQTTSTDQWEVGNRNAPRVATRPLQHRRKEPQAHSVGDGSGAASRMVDERRSHARRYLAGSFDPLRGDRGVAVGESQAARLVPNLNSS